MNSQRRAFLLFLLLAVTLCWALSLAGQRKARAMQRAAAIQAARSRHFEARPDGRFALVEADDSISKLLAPNADSPNGLADASASAPVGTPPSETPLSARIGPAPDLLELRKGERVSLVDAGLNQFLVFELPSSQDLRGDFLLSPDRSMALAGTAAQGAAQTQFWLWKGGQWKALDAAGFIPLNDSLKVSPGWSYLGFEARNQAGQGCVLAAPTATLAWAMGAGWSLVGIEDDGTAHLAQVDKLQDWQIGSPAP